MPSAIDSGETAPHRHADFRAPLAENQYLRLQTLEKQRLSHLILSRSRPERRSMQIHRSHHSVSRTQNVEYDTAQQQRRGMPRLCR